MEHTLTKAALRHLASHFPDAITFDELLASVQAIVIKEGGARHVEDHTALLGELFVLFAHQAIRLTPQPHHIDTSESDHPCLTPLARHQAEMKLGHLATLFLDAFATRLAELLDGSRSTKELVDQMTLAIERGKFL